MKLVLWVIALWLGLLVAGLSVAKAEFEQYEPVPVSTTCLTPWDEDGIWGYAQTDLPGWPLFLSPYVCDALRKGPSSKNFPNAVAVLYHEWVHSWFRTRNEGDAECISLYFLRYELRHVWHLTAQAAQRVYKRAWQTHELRGLLFPQYAGTCRYPQPDPVA